MRGESWHRPFVKLGRQTNKLTSLLTVYLAQWNRIFTPSMRIILRQWHEAECLSAFILLTAQLSYQHFVLFLWQCVFLLFSSFLFLFSHSDVDGNNNNTRIFCVYVYASSERVKKIEVVRMRVKGVSWCCLEILCEKFSRLGKKFCICHYLANFFINFTQPCEIIVNSKHTQQVAERERGSASKKR